MRDFSRLILGIVVVLLSLLSFFLWIQNKKLLEQSNLYILEKTSINADYDALQLEFQELSMRLQSLQELSNKKLTLQKQELEKKKIKISQLLRKERLSETELEKAKAMISELRKEKNSLIAQLKQISIENTQLKQHNQNLQVSLNDVSKQKRGLETVNQSLHLENEVLITEKKRVEDAKAIVEKEKNSIEKEKIKAEQQRNKLAKEQIKNAPKVEYAELLKVNDLVVQGVKYKNNGSEKATKNYKKIDKLSIKFNAGKNPVASSGTKTFYVRILNPDGTVVYDRQRGSGEFKNYKQQGMKYTTKTAIDYQEEQKNVTLFWRQDLPYQKGNYTIEIYQAGYKVANSSFELKSGL